MKCKAVPAAIAVLAALMFAAALSGCGVSNVTAENAAAVSEGPEGSLPAQTAQPEAQTEAEETGLTPGGTWETASMGYMYGGTAQPEYYVRFTDSEIIYGHLEGGRFAADHSDSIAGIEETAVGGVMIRAETAWGVRYTYRTCEDDDETLEYYETWLEEEFSEMYRGGASLSRCG